MASSDPVMKAPRIAGVDLAFAASLFALIAFSMAVVLTGTSSKLSGIQFDVLRDTFAAIYLFLNGLTISLMVQASPKAMSDLTPILVKRGLFFTITGIALSFFWPINILITLGVCTIACPILLYIHSSFLRFLALMIGVAALIIGSFTDLILTTEAIDTSKGFGSIIIDTGMFALLSGYYSIFPWALFFMLGVMYSRQDFLNKRTSTRSGFWALLAIVAGIGLEMITFKFFTQASALDARDVPFAFILPVYLPGFLIIAYGCCILALNISIWLNARLSKWKALHTLRQVGSMKHTFYYVHFVLGAILMAVMDSLNVENRMLIAIAVSAYFVICILFAMIWKKRHRLGPLEMLMDRFSGTDD